MVYESDFYTSRRPYSRPTISSYSVTRLGDSGDWDSPYSWPVRREFSRILHKPRPHVGIFYTERFLNSRPLTYFDDETKIIRAKAGAILKQVHAAVPKPSKILRPYETLDSYTSHQLIPYGVPQHIYQQSYYNEPAHLTIGRGHLACIQYAGGKGYPRRKHLYSDENRNIRDEIKFRSYYNRTKNDDPKSLATGFAWRLLHLPPKENAPFKIYRHSRTLPSLDSSEKKNDDKKSNEESKDTLSHKKYSRTVTQQEETAKKEINTKEAVQQNEEKEFKTSSFLEKEDDQVVESTNLKVEESLPVVQSQQEEDPKTDEVKKEHSVAEKIKKKKEVGDVKDKAPIKQSISKNNDKELIENQENLQMNHELEEPEIRQPVNEESVLSTVEAEAEIKTENIMEKEDIEVLDEKPHAESTQEAGETEMIVEPISAEEKQPNLLEEKDNEEIIKDPESNHELKESDQVINILTEPKIFTEQEEGKDNIDSTMSYDEEIAKEAIALSFEEDGHSEVGKGSENQEINSIETNVTSEKININSEAGDEDHATFNEPLPEELETELRERKDDNLELLDDNTDIVRSSSRGEESNVQIDYNETENEAEQFNVSDDAGVTITQIHEESNIFITQNQDSIEETIIQAVTSSTQITEALAESDKPESLDKDLVNETDATTDEENVEIPLE